MCHDARVTSRSVLLCCLLIVSGCRSKPTSDGAAASASAASSALASVDPWAGCTVLGAGESIVAQCAWPRSLTRAPLPAMTEEIFEKSSQRFFEKISKGGSSPERDDLTLADGKKALSKKTTGQRTNRSGRSMKVYLRTAGVKRAKGSGLFLTCVAAEDATCVANLKRMISSPPPPSKSLK